MSGEFFLIVAVVLVLGVIWIWINVLLFGKRTTGSRTQHKPTSSPADDSSPTSAIQTTSDAIEPSSTSGPLLKENKPSEPQQGMSASSAAAKPLDSNSWSQPANSEPITPANVELEEEVHVVLANAPAKPNVFARHAYPFRLNETVSAFDHEVWRNCFYRLTEDQDVLGWIAFAGEIVGASDRDYDSSFVDVLRSYQRTVDKLRKEVGLTHVSETSVVAEEGKIWFFAVVDDTWLALFADHNVDIHELANRLIGPVKNALAPHEN